jgi:CHC2 zinc finger
MNIDDILSRLEKVKQYNGRQWVACCPAHDDKTPSLAIKIGDENRVLMKCWAGCAIDEIVAAMDLSLSDLMGDVPKEHSNHKRGNRLSPTVVLKAVAANVLLAGIIVCDVAKAGHVTEEQKIKLLGLSGAFQEVVDYVEGL